jgi:hypothetical protein
VKPPAVWLRTRYAPGEPGRRVYPEEVDLVLAGDADVYKPNGERLISLRRGAIPLDVRERARPHLRYLKKFTSFNRGTAAGAERVLRVKRDGTLSKTDQTAQAVPSAIVGYYPRYDRTPYCRQTRFNAEHAERWAEVVPLIERVADVFAEAVPDRHEVQMGVARGTSPDFVVKRSDGTPTPFTTLTVNNTWETALHVDKGDLQEGFSCLAVLRSGDYSGGILTFPAFRVGVDLRDGDVVLMDAHEFHGNTPIVHVDPNAPGERISVVLYYREQMVACGSAREELERAKRLRGGLDGVG